jgi:transmembrane sensor
MSMNRTTRESPRQRERRIRAEAAAWFARRHGADRDAATEEGLQLWLSEDPDHSVQFKRAASVWNHPAQCLRKSTRRGIERPVLATFAAILTLTAVVGGVFFYLKPTTLSTGMGERLSQTLTDGTQVELNTDTHITVRYGVRQREIVLQSGEIYLNVIKHERRPFVVVAGDRKVVATGTSFVVRRDDSSIAPLTVTLIEGCVMISPTDTRDSAQTPGAYQATILNAGERARFRPDGPPLVDNPSLGDVTSWREGELIFADTPLSEAVQEFNRYSLNRIAVKSPKAESIRVNGIFRTEDSLSFIRTVAQDHHMTLQVQGDELILESVPPGSSIKKVKSLN